MYYSENIHTGIVGVNCLLAANALRLSYQSHTFTGNFLYLASGVAYSCSALSALHNKCNNECQPNSPLITFSALSLVAGKQLSDIARKVEIEQFVPRHRSVNRI